MSEFKKTIFLFILEIFAIKIQQIFLLIMTSLKSWHTAGVTWNIHNINLIVTWFTSFTGFADDIYLGIYNCHVQKSKLKEKSDKFGGT